MGIVWDFELLIIDPESALKSGHPGISNKN